MKIQSYIESIFGVDSNTSATIIITLLVFLIGIIVQRFFLLLNMYFERRKIRKFIKISFAEFEAQVRKQSKEYEKSAETFTFDKETNFEFKRATISTLSSLNSIGYIRTYEAFFNGFENIIKCRLGLKLKAFNKLYDSVKSVEFWHEKSFNESSGFIDKYNSFNERRNSALDKHRRFLDPIMFSIKGKDIPIDIVKYLQKVDQYHFDWQKLKDRTRPNIIHEQLVEKLLNLNRENQDIEIAVRMNDNLLVASIEFQNQKSLLKAQKEQLQSYARSFRQYYRLCKEVGKII